MDATELGLSTALGFQDLMDNRSSAQLSNSVDSLYAFNRVIFYLANNLRDTSKTYELISQCVHQIPWYHLENLLRLENPAVRQSWSQLLDWAFILGEKNFFESLVRILMKDPQLIQWYGARALTMAAWFDCHKICKNLIHYGVSPNHVCSIPSEISEKWKVLSNRSSLPLIEAALRGNTRSVTALLDGGADVHLRLNGYNAAGELLYALEQDFVDRKCGLATMQLLLERGTDVNEQMQELLSERGPECSATTLSLAQRGPPYLHTSFSWFKKWQASWQTPLSSFTNIPYYSVTTLLDHACLSGDSELAHLLQTFDKTPESQLTISNIITNAEKGFQELQNYLHLAYFPRGLRRQRMQEFSLHQCQKNPKAFLTMLRAGFDPKLSSIYDIGGRCPGDYLMRKTIESIFKHIAITSLSRDELSFVMHTDNALKAGLIQSCLESQTSHALKHLLDNDPHVTEEYGVVMMAEAARLGNFAAVSTLHSCGVDINGTVQIQEEECSVLLLAATNLYHDNELRLLQNNKLSSTEMLEFLIQYGANIDSCCPIMRSTIYRKYGLLSDATLRWLIEQGLDLTGLSICGIMTRLLTSGVSLSTLQFLIYRNLPIFAANEPLKDYRNFTTYTHPLSLFISLNPGPKFIDRVLETEIDVNGTRRHKKETPLQAATKQQDLELVKKLISRGAAVNDTNIYAYTPLQIACSQPDFLQSVRFDLARCLLENGADPNNVHYGRTVLSLAMLLPDPSIQLIELLLEYKANIPSSILHEVLTKSHFSGPDKRRVIEMLINKGADVSAICWEDHSEKLYKEYMKHKRDIFRTDKDRFLPRFILHELLVQSHFLGPCKRRVIELFISKGARINARWMVTSNEGPSPESGCADFVKMKERHYELRGNDCKLGPSALEVTCSFNGPDCTDIVRLLLDQGADPNPPNGYNGPNALEIACAVKNIDLLELLLDRGISLNVYNCKYILGRGPNTDILKLLLDRGLDLNKSNALSIACKNRNFSLIKFLLDRGMNPNPRDWESRGPLAVAAWNGDFTTAVLLLAAGAKVSVGGYDEYRIESPLVAATYKGRLDMVALLLDGETREEVFEKAASEARELGYPAIESLIQEHVKKRESRTSQVQTEELSGHQSSNQNLGMSSAAPFADTDVEIIGGPDPDMDLFPL